jgi:hypothetical protein
LSRGLWHRLEKLQLLDGPDGDYGIIASMAERFLGRPRRFWETEVKHKFVLVFSIAAAHCAFAAGADDLAATSWRLVEIQSMDGSVDVPGDVSQYTLEFEPAADAEATATVLGEDLRTTDVGELREAILSRLFDRYAAEQGLKDEVVEIDAYLDILRMGRAAEGLTAGEDLSPQEASEVETVETAMAASLIRQWKINKSLYGQYGGRIIYQQLGPEPLDAIRQFLEQRRSAGAFAIHDQELADDFWNYFTDKSIHDFMEPGSAAEAFDTPPWQRKG